MTPLLQQVADKRRARRIRLGMTSEPMPSLRAIEQPKEPKPVDVKPELRRSPFRLANEILRLVARDFGLTSADLIGKRRSPKVIKARYIAIYLVSRINTAWSTTKLGNFFHRNHSTIILARRKIALQRAIYSDLREKLSYLEALINCAVENVNGAS